MDQPIRLQYLFDRYLSGACSPAEVEELVALLHQEGAEPHLREQLQTLWDRSGENETLHTVDWDNMFAAIRSSDEDLVGFRQYQQRRSWRWWARGAAAAILCLAAGAAWWASRTHIQETPKAALAKTSAPTKVHTIHLPDGSTVVLNTESRLDYPTAFTGKTREVYLSGEGFFDIRSVAGQPFLVHTGKLTTRVLGTTFDIKAYPGDGTIDITVTKGKVQVLNEQKDLGTLVANQQIHFVPSTEAVRQLRVDPQPIVAWKPREVFYDNITMDSAARSLEQRFGVTVTFRNDALRACRVTATFSPEDGLDEILTVLCGVTASTYSEQGKEISLDGKGCQ
jgi:ferric-dicitrate binding protein FerR (iron transport regulator)